MTADNELENNDNENIVMVDNLENDNAALENEDRSIEELPDVPFIHLMSYLTHSDKKCLRLGSPSLAHRVKCFDSNFNIWKINISNQNYGATLADMRKYVQSLDYGDSAVGLHVDLSKYKGMDISLLKLIAHRITGIVNIGVDTLDYLVKSGINFWKLTTLGLENVRDSDLDNVRFTSELYNSTEEKLPTDLDILDKFMDQCKIPLQTLIMNSCEFTEDFIIRRKNKFCALETVLLESDMMKEIALGALISTSCRTLKRLQMNDIRVGMSFERIAVGLDCLNLQNLKIFSQISVMSGLGQFIQKSSHSLHSLHIESYHQRDNSAAIQEPISFPSLRTLHIANLGSTVFPPFTNLSNLTSLTIESVDYLRTNGLLNILDKCSNSLRKLELLTLIDGVNIVPDCDIPYLTTLKIDTITSSMRSTKMGVQVLKLLSRCPNIETLILKGKGIIDFGAMDDVKFTLASLKFLVLETMQGHTLADLTNLSKFLRACSSSIMEVNLTGNLVDLDLTPEDNFPSLRSVIIKGTNQPGPSLVNLLDRCPSTLRSLDLSLPVMDLTWLQDLPAGLPELRKLNLRSRNKEKPALGLVEFLDMVSTTLQSLNLWHIKLQDMDKLSRDLPQLKHVSIYPKSNHDDLQPLKARCPAVAEFK